QSWPRLDHPEIGNARHGGAAGGRGPERVDRNFAAAAQWRDADVARLGCLRCWKVETGENRFAGAQGLNMRVAAFVLDEGRSLAPGLLELKLERRKFCRRCLGLALRAFN